MALTHTTAVRNALADLVVDLLEAGAGAGKIQISTTQGDYVGAELLAEITMDDPAFGNAAAGVATMLAPPKSDTSADNTGTAAWFRIVDSNDLEIFEGTVTATAGGGDMELSSVSIVSGEQVNITAFTYAASA